MLCALVCPVVELELKMAAEPGSELEADLFLFEQEYFSARISDSDSDSNIDGESDRDRDERTDDDDSSTANMDDMTEVRELDKDEIKNVQQFNAATCGCTKKNGSPCSNYFTVQELSELRMQMSELENDHLDLVVLSQIHAHHFMKELVGHRRMDARERSRDYTTFFYHGHSICLKTFLFIHSIGKKRFRNLLKHYQLNGVSPRVHGNVKRRPWNAASFPDKERAVTFIKNFAEAHALPLPGRMPKFYDYSIMLLPSDVSKASVHREYMKATRKLEETIQKPMRIFGYREFCRLWSEVVPYIRVMPPADDLCPTCQDNASLILKSANLSEDEKSQRLQIAEKHLQCAKKQRNYYREQVRLSQGRIKSLPDNHGQPISLAISLAYSFDHAQQVHYPSNPQQPGPLFFKTPRKCGIFGVCSEGCNTQVNYLIDEAQSCGKGANSIVSMVHHYLGNFTQGEEDICLHADNCVGQNKNNTMVWYLVWRVVTGLSKACELNFMIPGHTRFSPDRFFGLIKRKFRRSKVSSLSQIAEVVESSTTGGQNKAYIIGDESMKPFTYYDWADFLSDFFTTIPHITTYYHFRCKSDHPGVVFVREFADSEEKEVSILKPSVRVDRDALPSQMTPPGLSLDRQWYLYEQIRQFCDEEFQDVTCPEPRMQKHSRTQDEDESPPVKRSKRLCSYCRMPGHTKTKKGVVTCPKLLKETGK